MNSPRPTPPSEPPAAQQGSALVLPQALSVLGLTPVEARVLAVVADAGYTTSVAMAAQLRMSRPKVSDALRTLEQLGFVQRTRGRRPAPVSLHDRFDEALDLRLSDLAERRAEDSRRVHAAAEQLRTQRSRRDEGPRPLWELDASREQSYGRIRRAWRSHHEVTRTDGPSYLYGGGLVRGVAATDKRLILLGQPDVGHLDWFVRHGVDVRTSAEDLPLLLIVDGVRASVQVAFQGRSDHTGWTSAPAQVRAVERLFSWWWEESATPAVVR